MPNSSPITITEFNTKKSYLSSAPYGSSSSFSADFSATDVVVLMALDSNATLGFDLGAVQTVNSRVLSIIISSADNTTGEINSGTKYFSTAGEITAQGAGALMAEYQNHRDQYTPATMDGFFMEAANVAALQGQTGYAGVRITALRESANGPLNIAIQAIDSSGNTIGTVCYNYFRPKPRP